MNCVGEIIGEQMGAGGVAPAPVQGQAEEHDIEPVDEQGDAIVDELGEQRSGKRCERDSAEEGDVNPGEIAVGAGEVIELRLLADPEDAVGHDAHQKDDEARGENDESLPEIALREDRVPRGDAEVEDEESHGHGKDAVAERGETFDALSGNTIVEGWHRKEFSGLQGRGQNGFAGVPVHEELQRGLAWGRCGRSGCGYTVSFCC